MLQLPEAAHLIIRHRHTRSSANSKRSQQHADRLYPCILSRCSVQVASRAAHVPSLRGPWTIAFPDAHRSMDLGMTVAVTVALAAGP